MRRVHFASNCPISRVSHACLKSNGRIGSLGQRTTCLELRPLTPEGRGREAFPMEKHAGRTRHRFRARVASGFRYRTCAGTQKSRGRGIKPTEKLSPATPHSYSNQDQKVMWTIGHFGELATRTERKGKRWREERGAEREREVDVRVCISFRFLRARCRLPVKPI